VGAALSVDISAFTPFAQALGQKLGLQLSAEELAHQLDQPGNALISEVHRYRGSAVGFGGQVITCGLMATTPNVPPPVLWRCST
jgi:adenylate cyclase